MANQDNHHILVIEDNPGDFALVEEFLLEEINSPLITQAANYKEAREILCGADAAFDIILLDISLPDKTGLPLIEDIVGISRHAPVIVLTGYSDLSFGVRSLSSGVSDYILKDELTALSLYKSIVYSMERKRIMLALANSELRARTFAKQINNVSEEERSHIAREIHDEFGQQLSGLKMSLSSLKRNPGVSSDVTPIIETIIDEVDTSIRSLRKIANELRPVLIDKLGLFVALEWLVTEFGKKTGVSSHLYADIDQPQINKTHEINIFRICQEALTNITKHAEATEVSIKIQDNKEHLLITITDNGNGMAPAALHNQLSMGLLNMKERATLMGADLNINSSAGKGTSVELKIDLNGNEDINS